MRPIEGLDEIDGGEPQADGHEGDGVAVDTGEGAKGELDREAMGDALSEGKGE